MESTTQKHARVFAGQSVRGRLPSHEDKDLAGGVVTYEDECLQDKRKGISGISS
jgi:hypothetical protein